MGELDKLRDQIAGPSNWVNIEKYKLLEFIELWLAAAEVAKAPNTASPAFARVLNELRRVVHKLG